MDARVVYAVLYQPEKCKLQHTQDADITKNNNNLLLRERDGPPAYPRERWGGGGTHTGWYNYPPQNLGMLK
jgi:hypothetical protein